MDFNALHEEFENLNEEIGENVKNSQNIEELKSIWQNMRSENGLKKVVENLAPFSEEEDEALGDIFDYVLRCEQLAEKMYIIGAANEALCVIEEAEKFMPKDAPQSDREKLEELKNNIEEQAAEEEAARQAAEARAAQEAAERKAAEEEAARQAAEARAAQEAAERKAAEEEAGA